MDRMKIISLLVVLISLSSISFGMYDTKTGRFMQRDPLGIDPAGGKNNTFWPSSQHLYGMNIYEYVKSSSLKYVDPDGLFAKPWPPTEPPTMPIEPIERGICLKIKLKWKAKIIVKAAELGWSLPEVFPNYESMPFQHCMWNCRMTMVDGRKHAERMSKIKEELDNMYADYGVELKKSGCWPSLSGDEQKSICHGARSAEQPSDYSDNETGIKCGEKKKCWYVTMDDHCKDCCTANGVGPSTCDGPPLRDWGARIGDFPECSFHDPGPGTGCDGTNCSNNQYAF